MDVVLGNPVRAALDAIAQVMAPPPPVDYRAWACRNIVFTERESQFAGPYNPDLFPFFDEIFAALSPDDPCRIVTWSKSAQLGGTALATIFTLGSMDMDPGDFLFVHPTEDNARRWSRMKLQPMLNNTPAVRGAFPSKSRDGGDSVFFKERVDGRGAIQISGANSPASLSLVSMRRQTQDDLAKWETNAAGDPETQADSRSRAHEFAKVLKISTPLILPGCRITRNFRAGSQERYHLPCPHCGHFQVLEWANMLAHLDEAHPERAHFVCVGEDCGGVIEEHHRPAMLRKGRWIADNPQAKRHHRSFWLWSAYSPLQSWETIAREWLKAKGEPGAEQVFLNDTCGLPYETKGEAPPWETLRDRAAASDYQRGEVPAWAVVLTLGLDCQKDRVEWQLVGWGRSHRRAVIDAGVVPGHISELACQARLDDLMRSTWSNTAGRRLGADMAAIDGNAWTEDVWGWARRWPASRLVMMRGVASESAPLLERVKRETNYRTGKRLRYSSRFYNVGVSSLKLFVYRDAGKTDPLERGFVALPRGLEDGWFQQFCAERRVPHKRKDGFVRWQWEKDPGQANEALDTHLQAWAAAIKFGVRDFPDAVWDRLEAERGTAPAEGQLDIEDALARPAPAATPAAAAPPAGARVSKKSPPASLAKLNRK